MNIDLMKRVKARVLAEPKTVIMNTWLENITEEVKKLNAKWVKEYGEVPYKALACGTVGCIAGHTVLEAVKPKEVNKILQESSTEKIARGLLGLSQYEAEALFLFFEAGQYFTCESSGNYVEIDDSIYADEREDLKNCTPGTKKYAKVVARAIDKCIERNNYED